MFMVERVRIDVYLSFSRSTFLDIGSRREVSECNLLGGQPQ